MSCWDSGIAMVGFWCGLVVPAVAVSCASCAAGRGPAVASYVNPIVTREEDCGADPAVLLHDGVFYYYSTNAGLTVFSSTDLVHWSRGPQVLPDEFKGVWAPEVYYHPEDGKFYMYYTRRYTIGVAVADRPDAMFKDLGLLVINAIDAHPFRDDDGRLYLYFTHTPPFDMYCVPMKSPTETGGPVTRCFQISQDWERRSFPINEGPWMLKRDGLYYLLYSGSDGQSVYYAVGYATAPTPIGPFTKHPNNPIFQDLPTIHGPGHGSVTRDREGRLWHLYHQKTGTEKGWSRDVCLDPLDFDDRGVLGGRPTRGTRQAAPALDPSLVWSPDIRPRGAVFSRDVVVSLSSMTPGAVIRYTLDRSDPDAASPLYTGPFVLDRSAMVKARAFKAGMKTSTVSAMQFTQTNDPLPENPSPHAPAGNPPFEVFPRPNADWQPPKRP